MPVAPLTQRRVADWDSMIDVNIRGTCLNMFREAVLSKSKPPYQIRIFADTATACGRGNASTRQLDIGDRVAC